MAVQTGLWLETLKTGFLTTRLKSEEEIRCVFDDNKLKDNFCPIFIKTYVLGAHAILMRINNIDFYEEISKIIP